MAQQIYFPDEYFVLEYFPMEYWVVYIPSPLSTDPRRIFVVKPENRTLMIEDEDRVFVVPPESRTTVVEDEL